MGNLHIISLISAIFLFIGIMLFKLNDLKANLKCLMTLIVYWIIATLIINFGVIIDTMIWLVLQEGLDTINITFGHVLMNELLKVLMLVSFPALIMAHIVINKNGYINNFNKILICAVLLLIVPDILVIIIANNIWQTNFIFYTIFNDLFGSVLIGIVLSLIFTKLNAVIFKQKEINKRNVQSYVIVAITLTMFLSFIIYLMFVNQFPSKVIIKLTDWRVIEFFHYDGKGISIIGVIRPDIKSDLSKYRNYKIDEFHVHGPIGSMEVNSINFNLSRKDNIIIKLPRLDIEKNKNNELVIDIISRSVKVKDQIIPMTLWSYLSSNQQIAIISGIFLVIAAIIGPITKAIYVNFQKGT